MIKPKQHVFVCTSSRANGQQKGFCHTKNGVSIVESFMEEVADNGLSGEVMVTNTGCLAICEQGPIVIIYPDNVWYGQVTADDVEELVAEHLIEGRVVERLCIEK